jgi:hypothetical protein
MLGKKVQLNVKPENLRFDANVRHLDWLARSALTRVCHAIASTPHAAISGFNCTSFRLWKSFLVRTVHNRSTDAAVKLRHFFRRLPQQALADPTRAS